jgi:putative flippase GtrA
MVQKLLQHPIYLRHREKVKFMLVGGLNTGLDFVLYGLLANALGVWPVAANLLSVGVCMVASFGLNIKFVWRSQKTMRETVVPFLAVSGFSGWIVQSGGIWLITSLLGGWFVGATWLLNLLAKAVAVAVALGCNYLGYRAIFRERRV